MKKSNLQQKKNIQKKYPFYFYLIAVAIPFFLLVILESALRYFDYGKNLDQWIDAGNGKYMLNTEIAFRYFYNTNSIPYPIGDLFDIEKEENTFRVFVLGASSAAGYPFTPSGTFSKYIKKRLELEFPEKNIEVVNLAFAAINTYSILDLLPGIIEQKPDLILIYAGHNEYYGALGAGSSESLGNIRPIVKFMLSMNRFKTTQLLRDLIKKIIAFFSADEERHGTLMSRMAKEQEIALGSPEYELGIKQFEGNLNDIFKLAKDAHIPIIISDLTCNLKDQKPFINIKSKFHPTAEKIFNDAKKELNKGNFISAKKNFYLAKDLDGLKFRAPQEINNIIYKLAEKFNFDVVKTDSVFNALSPNGIVGNNLMMDHLHPTLEGYKLIGKLFYEKMVQKNHLPSNERKNYERADEIVKDNFDFTELDSVISHYRIIILKSDWPYVKTPKTTRQTLAEMNPRNFRDSLALQVIDNRIGWEKAHRIYASHLLKKNDDKGFAKEMNAIMYQYPTIDDYYKIAVKDLLSAKKFDTALNFLYGYYQRMPDAFSAKWIGTINLSKNNFAEAIKFLERSSTLNPNDAQVLYNLSGAYSLTKNYEKALAAINSCLMLNPNYPGAENLQTQIKNILSRNLKK